MSSPNDHKGRPYRRLQQWVYATFDTCFRCGGWVDKDIRFVDPRHPMAPSLEHPVPIAQGGDPLSRDNAALSHYGCNAGYRDGKPAAGQASRRVTAPGGGWTGVRYRPSRAW